MNARKLVPDLFISLLFGLVIMLIISMQECGCNISNIPVEWLAFTLLLSTSLYLINKNFAIALQKHLAKRWHRFFVYLCASPVVTSVVLFLIRYLIFGRESNYQPVDFLLGESLQFYLLSAAIALVTGGIFYAFNALKALKDAQITTEKAKSSLSETKFIHLKNQIDPHFLFNSLNVLSGLIEEDAEKAFRYTNSLSAIYRSMLSQKDKDLVPLREELATGKEFLYLLQIRFEGALTYEIESGLEQEQKFVVPLCLQLLLENAVKHNEASEVRPLHIKIFSDSDYLVVENNLQPRNSFVESNKLGLSIITERYRSLTEKPVRIEQNDGIFRVALPLMTKI